VIFNSKYV